MPTDLTSVLDRHLRDAAPAPQVDLTQVVRRALKVSKGGFGAFVVSLLEQGVDLPICGSEKSKDEKRFDGTAIENYLALFGAWSRAVSPKQWQSAWRELPGWMHGEPKKKHAQTTRGGTIKELVSEVAEIRQRRGRKLSSFRPPRGATNQLSLFRAPPDPPTRQGSRADLGAILRRRLRPRRGQALPRLTSLSMGGGARQHRPGALARSLRRPVGGQALPQAAREASRYRDEDPDRDVLAIFSDTGIEYPYTYEALDKLERHLRRSPHPFDLVRLSKPRVPSAVMVAALSTASPIANQPGRTVARGRAPLLRRVAASSTPVPRCGLSTWHAGR